MLQGETVYEGCVAWRAALHGVSAHSLAQVYLGYKADLETDDAVAHATQARDVDDYHTIL